MGSVEHVQVLSINYKWVWLQSKSSPALHTASESGMAFPGPSMHAALAIFVLVVIHVALSMIIRLHLAILESCTYSQFLLLGEQKSRGRGGSRGGSEPPQAVTVATLQIH